MQFCPAPHVGAVNSGQPTQSNSSSQGSGMTAMLLDTIAVQMLRRSFRAGILIFAATSLFSIAAAQEGVDGNKFSSGRRTLQKHSESIQMVINTSQTIVLEKTIDVTHIHNETIVDAQPVGRNEFLISALATGVTQVDFVTKEKEMFSLQVVVLADARELQSILDQVFPTASLIVRPIQQAVIISGQVTSDEHVEQVVAIAEQYYPRVINQVEVVGVHTVMLQTQVMEISRTKLRNLGIDWQTSAGTNFFTQSASGLIGQGATSGSLVNAGNESFKFGVVSSDHQFFGLVRALRQNNLAKVMADPTVVAIDGRPASFNSGGEFPIVVPAGLGQVGIEFKEFGTRLDFVAKVRGDGRIWLEVRPTISEIDPGRSVVISGVSVPGIRSRFVDTAVELRAGETLALAGLLQMRTESESVGVIGLSDVPYLGALFRANKEVQNEVELLILVTPNFAAPMLPHEVPAGGPGFNSSSPLDRELYLKGYIETPATCGPQGGVECGPNCGPNASSAMPYDPAGAAYAANSVQMMGQAPNANGYAAGVASRPRAPGVTGVPGTAAQSPTMNSYRR